MSYGTDYIDIPIKKPYRVGRTFTKMSNNKPQTTEAPKVKSKYAKTRGEHSKDLIIAILVSGIIAFIGGMTFQSKQQEAIKTAVNAVTPAVSAQAPVKK